MALFVLLSQFALWNPAAIAASPVGTPAHCLAPLIREKHIEQLIDSGSDDEQVKEGREIVRWFRSHAEEVDQLAALKELNEAQSARLHTLSLEMHEKLREWSMLMRLARGAKRDIVLSESAESVLEVYLKALRASPVLEEGMDPTVSLRRAPEILMKTPVGELFESLARRKVKLKIANRAAINENVGVAFFDRNSQTLAVTHRFLAEQTAGVTEVHELEHLATWAAQMAGKDVLFAGYSIPPAGGLIAFDELLAHSAGADAALRFLSQPQLSKLARRELTEDLHSEIASLHEYRQLFTHPISTALSLMRTSGPAKRAQHFFADLMEETSISPKKVDAHLAFELHPNDKEEHLLVFELAPFGPAVARKKTIRRLEVLQRYLQTLDRLFKEFEEQSLSAALQGEAADLERYRKFNAANQKAIRAAHAEYRARKSPGGQP